MKFRSMYDDKQKQATQESAIFTDPETAKYAQQSDKDSCDINKIVDRYLKTGLMPEPARQAFYMDITELQDANAYQTALNQVNAANKAFNALPAHIRGMFGNDPKAFVDAMDKKQFTKEMADAGLVEIIKAAPAPTGADDAPKAIDQLIQKGTPA